MPVLASADLSRVRMVCDMEPCCGCLRRVPSGQGRDQPRFGRCRAIEASQGLGQISLVLGGIGDLKPRHGLDPETEQPVPAGQPVPQPFTLLRSRCLDPVRFHEELARAGGMPGVAPAGPALWPRFAGYSTRDSRACRAGCGAPAAPDRGTDCQAVPDSTSFHPGYEDSKCRSRWARAHRATRLRFDDVWRRVDEQPDAGHEGR